MSAFVTYACFEWCTPLVNECVDCALFNTVLNVYFSHGSAATDSWDVLILILASSIDPF